MEHLGYVVRETKLHPRDHRIRELYDQAHQFMTS
jgi:hypothetical protein